MARLILDSGAVIALAARDARTRAFIARAIKERTTLILPAVAIAETTRGTARDATVNRIVNMVDEISPVTEAVARQAGRLLATTGGTPTVDALIAAEAVLSNAAILTGDPVDLSTLVADYPRVQVHKV